MPLGLGVALQQPYNGKDNRGNCGSRGVARADL